MGEGAIEGGELRRMQGKGSVKEGTNRTANPWRKDPTKDGIAELIRAQATGASGSKEKGEKGKGGKRKGGKRKGICWYVLIGVLSMGGLSACGVLRPAREERAAFRTEIYDSLRRMEKSLFDKHVSQKSVRHERGGWQEINLSVPDSTGRQYISGIRTEAVRAVEIMALEDTVSVRSFRQDTGGTHFAEEGMRRQQIPPEIGWKWIGVGIILVFLFCRWGFRATFSGK